MTRFRAARRALPAAVATLALLSTGCGSDDKASGTVKVTAEDYSYDDLPSEAETGTVLTLTNSSSKELHEIAAFRLPDGETRPVADLVKLPQAELSAVLGGPPAMVLLAMPSGAPEIKAVGDGTLKDPGRYAIICTIPTGADPAAYLQAAQTSGDGPPQVAGGPPHFTKGMYGQVVVG
ncbi:MAG: hypothetical protein QOD63_827 [Actinomycetota bacterium]|jgi:plastocyanin|nr:hypothetical protein [Actinomycetota bacterium]